MRDHLDTLTQELPGLPPPPPLQDRREAPRWHAPRAGNQAAPLCGQSSATGGPTHRVSRAQLVTCLKCQKALQRAPQ